MRGNLILCYRITHERAVNPVDWAAIIAQLRKLLLNGGDRWVNHRSITVYVLIIVVRLNVGVIAGIVVVRIVIVGVVWVVVPGEEPVIQSAPGTIDKDKEAIVEEVRMPSVPIAVPILVVTFSDMGVERGPAGCSILPRRCIIPAKIRSGHGGRSLSWRTHLSGARVRIMHASAIVVSGPTTKAGSAKAHSTSAPIHSASGVSAAKTTSTTENACTPFVTSCPASVGQCDRCDAH